MLIFVHGMGENTAGWSGSEGGPGAKMNAVAARYPDVGQQPFTEQLLVKEITYDNCFSDLVTPWAESPEAIGKWAEASGRSVPGIASWLDKQLPSSSASAKNFFWTTAIDVLLYRGFALVRDRVRESVISQLVTLLKDATADGAVSLTIVAHSLGTAVLHDALHLLGTGQTPPSVGDVSMLSPENFKVENIFMLADVCLLGPGFVHDIEYFSSIVRPVNGPTRGYCQNFFEVWHRYDPFAVLAPFRPSDWGEGYVPIGPLSHFRQANVHGFTHYLDHPAVHIPIINQALGGEVITRATEHTAIDAYPDFVSPECNQQIDRMKNVAKEFAGTNEDLEALVIRIALFYAAARTAASECGGLRTGL